MTVLVRPTQPSEHRAAADAMATALLLSRYDDPAFERSRPSWDEMSSLSAWDGDRCVGHAGQFLVDTTVPGGARLATGAVSRVGVLPTHRRRGIATALMEGLVADASARGLPLMSLRASEAVIYRRYGFGVAGESCELRIDPARARPLGGVGAGTGELQMLTAAELLAVLPPLYERVALWRPGAVTRPASWWQRYLRAAVEHSSPSFVVVHAGAGGEPDGYVHYDVRWSERPGGGSTGAGTVHDLFGASDAVELALWGYVLDIDLVTGWTAEVRPLDDVVRLATHDRRACAVRGIDDEQWLRLVDVDAALGARAYAPAAGAVTIAVHDPLLPANVGTWRVEAGGAERVDAAVDLAVTIDALSAAYLGGTRWRSLVAAGRVDVRTPAAVDAADRLFLTPHLPFCGSFF